MSSMFIKGCSMRNSMGSDIWAQDFVSALQDRPWIARIIFKFVFGKYAYREFIGMVERLEIDYGVLHYDMGYELKDMEYNKAKVMFDFKNHIRDIHTKKKKIEKVNEKS